MIDEQDVSGIPMAKPAAQMGCRDDSGNATPYDDDSVHAVYPFESLPQTSRWPAARCSTAPANLTNSTGNFPSLF
jgi:hypothetical protein